MFIISGQEIGPGQLVVVQPPLECRREIQAFCSITMRINIAKQWPGAGAPGDAQGRFELAVAWLTWRSIRLGLQYEMIYLRRPMVIDGL
jgi:hypothetical protein